MKGYNKDEEQFELVGDDTETGSRQQTKDRHGKPIKHSRYMKTFYTATVTANLKCLRCGETFDHSEELEQQASGFDEC